MLEKSTIDLSLRNFEHPANVAHVLLRLALTEVLELAKDHVFHRRDGDAQLIESDCPLMGEGPAVQLIKRDVHIGLEPGVVVDQVAMAALAAPHLDRENFLGRQ